MTDHEVALWSLLTLIANYNPAFVYNGQPMTLVDEVARLLAASKLALPDGIYKLSKELP